MAYKNTGNRIVELEEKIKKVGSGKSPISYTTINTPGSNLIVIYTFKEGGNDSLGTHNKKSGFKPDSRYEIIVDPKYYGTKILQDWPYESVADAITSFDTALKLSGTPTKKDITATYQTRDWRNDLGKKVEINNTFAGMISYKGSFKVLNGVNNGVLYEYLWYPKKSNKTMLDSLNTNTLTNSIEIKTDSFKITKFEIWE